MDFGGEDIIPVVGGCNCFPANRELWETAGFYSSTDRVIAGKENHCGESLKRLWGLFVHCNCGRTTPGIDPA